MADAASGQKEAALGRREGAGPPQAGLDDPGPIRNTALQLASQVATTLFTAGLTLYLVRALGASNYGLYALAYGIGALLSFPAGLGLPMAMGRFVADHRGNLAHARALLMLGLRLQVPAALLMSVALFALAAPVAHAYGRPALVWPLRWMAVALCGLTLFTFLTSMATSLLRVMVSLRMVVIESAAETSTAIALVAAGTGAAGAMLGKAIGYAVAVAAGLFLTLRLVGRRSNGGALPDRVGLRAVTRYAGAMLIVDVTYSAITQIDVLLIGAVLTSAAVGSFSAVVRILTVLGYLGIAVAGGIAPRLSLGGGSPDTRSFNQAIRYLVIVQGLVIAPMVVWAKPIVGLLLGPGYHSSPEIMRVLAVHAFVSPAAAPISGAVTYLGEARRRVPIVLGTLALGLIATYPLLRLVGVVGAAIADDMMMVVYVGAHLWLCSRLVTVEVRTLIAAAFRTVIAAGAMALPLLAVGTGHLSVAGWLIGGLSGIALYGLVLVVTGELSVAELRQIVARLRSGFRLQARSGVGSG